MNYLLYRLGGWLIYLSKRQARFENDELLRLERQRLENAKLDSEIYRRDVSSNALHRIWFERHLEKVLAVQIRIATALESIDLDGVEVSVEKINGSVFRNINQGQPESGTTK